MSRKKPSKPVWYRNTYFWIAAVLLVLTVVGLPFLGGDSAIRDPGQRRESNLYVIYFIAAIVMLLNGWISHLQSKQQFDEDQAGANS